MSLQIRRVAALIAALLIPGSVEAASIGACGGGGGSQSATLSCPTGQYIVGVFARGGSYVDRIGIRCAPFTIGTGARGAPGAFQYAGGTGGSTSKSATCSGNRAVARIATRSGGYVDSATDLICVPRISSGGFSALGGSNNKFISFEVGGNGGDSCVLACPGGEAMNRIIVRYGSWIDSIEAFCRP